MIAVTERKPNTTRAERLSNHLPVDLLENDGQGRTWLRLEGWWQQVISMRNLWDIDGYTTGGQPALRMHFRATLEGGRQVTLFQDLIDGSWRREITLGDTPRPTPIYRA